MRETINMASSPIRWQPVEVERHTKWAILEARREALTDALARLEADLRWMERTEFGRHCSGCGQLLETEKDFADHYIVNDRFQHLLNLGECPFKTPAPPATEETRNV